MTTAVAQEVAYTAGALGEAVCEPLPAPSPGMVCHARGGRGVSTCMTCRDSGVPTKVGGRKVGRVRRYFPGWTPVRTVEGSTVLHTCPHCDDEGDYLEHELLRGRGRQRRVTKVPRNDPCPCGSGKKAKRCCHR